MSDPSDKWVIEYRRTPPDDTNYWSVSTAMEYKPGGKEKWAYLDLETCIKRGQNAVQLNGYRFRNIVTGEVLSWETVKALL